MAKTVAMITDFGWSDPYVGILKGVLARLDSKITIVDLCHGIPSYAVNTASFVLETSISFFPKRTVFLVVVDPGVGTERGILAACYRDSIFIAPDNGVLTPVLAADHKMVWKVDYHHSFLISGRSTFEARDKMAPLAVWMLQTRGIEAPGRLFSQYITNADYWPKTNKRGISGKIVYVDKFGNMITNISGKFLDENQDPGWRTTVQAEINGITVRGFHGVYANGPVETPFLLIGSHGNLEIALNTGSAADFLHAGLGQDITLSAT